MSSRVVLAEDIHRSPGWMTRTLCDLRNLASRQQLLMFPLADQLAVRQDKPAGKCAACSTL